jgi:hypothetical protein
MRKLGAFVLMCCLSMANPAFATTWIRVASDRLGAVYYVDADSIRRTGNIVRYWLRVDYTNDRTIAWRETKSFYKVDCESWTHALIQSTRYDAQGSVVGTDTFSEYAAMSQMIPETTGEAAAEYACAGQ